jgi:putative lipoprotein
MRLLIALSATISLAASNAGCSLHNSSEPEQTELTGAVHGTVTYRERMALTPDAEVEIKLLDVSLADVAATEIASITVSNPGQVPVEFSLPYDPNKIIDRHTYAVRADIRDRGRRMFTTDTSYPVLTRGNSNAVDLVLIAMNSNPISKPNASLTETYWRVISIYEVPYKPSENQREAHLKLRVANNAVEGSSGCNNFGGTYTLTDGKMILGPLAMTMMACIDLMEVEQNYMQALGEMGRYEIAGDTMLVYHEDAVILRFEAIYF